MLRFNDIAKHQGDDNEFAPKVNTKHIRFLDWMDITDFLSSEVESYANSCVKSVMQDIADATLHLHKVIEESKEELYSISFLKSSSKLDNLVAHCFILSLNSGVRYQDFFTKDYSRLVLGFFCNNHIDNMELVQTSEVESEEMSKMLGKAFYLAFKEKKDDKPMDVFSKYHTKAFVSMKGEKNGIVCSPYSKSGLSDDIAVDISKSISSFLKGTIKSIQQNGRCCDLDTFVGNCLETMPQSNDATIATLQSSLISTSSDCIPSIVSDKSQISTLSEWSSQFKGRDAFKIGESKEVSASATADLCGSLTWLNKPRVVVSIYKMLLAGDVYSSLFSSSSSVPYHIDLMAMDGEFVDAGCLLGVANVDISKTSCSMSYVGGSIHMNLDCDVRFNILT